MSSGAAPGPRPDVCHGQEHVSRGAGLLSRARPTTQLTLVAGGEVLTTAGMTDIFLAKLAL